MTPREEIDLPLGIKLKGEGVAGMLTRQAGWLVAVGCLIYALIGPLARVESKVKELEATNGTQHFEIKTSLYEMRAELKRIDNRLASTGRSQIARVP